MELSKNIILHVQYYGSIIHHSAHPLQNLRDPRGPFSYSPYSLFKASPRTLALVLERRYSNLARIEQSINIQHHLSSDNYTYNLSQKIAY